MTEKEYNELTHSIDLLKKALDSNDGDSQLDIYLDLVSGESTLITIPDKLKRSYLQGLYDMQLSIKQEFDNGKQWLLPNNWLNG